MKLAFTDHAKFRIIERGISVEKIKTTLKNPEYSEKVFGDKYKVGKTFGGKTLEIIYTRNKNNVVIITAYFL